MARETVTKLIDDLDGSAADSSVAFALDGHDYTIDLNARNETELRTLLEPYVEVARKVRPQTGGAGVSVGRRARTVSDKERNAAIRSWALDEGVELNQRGRIAAVVQQAYDAQDGDMLREALGLELVVEEKPARRRRVAQPQFSEA